MIAWKYGWIDVTVITWSPEVVLEATELKLTAEVGRTVPRYNHPPPIGLQVSWKVTGLADVTLNTKYV